MENEINAVEINETELAADQSPEEELDDVDNGDSQASDIQEDDSDDYSEEFEKLQKRLKQAEHTIIKEKGEKRETESAVEELKNKIKTLEQVTQASIISKYTANQNAQELIKYHMENTVRPSGNIETDVANAYAIVQANVQKKRETEVKVAENAKKTAGTGSSTGSQDKPKASKKFWSDDQIADLKKRGLDPDIAWRNYQELLNK